MNYPKRWRNTEQQKKITSRGGDGKKHTFKPSGPVCPLSNIRLGVNDPRATTFLVNGQEVVVNYDSFMERCRKFGWNIPKLSAGSKLDADTFVLGVAKKFVNLDADIETQKQLEQVRIFADLIGMTNFTSKLKRACQI
ncbi:MAG: hypothetical protein WC349_02840 [Patescibacteria group bacterium]|jgi:hypothetical protein